MKYLQILLLLGCLSLFADDKGIVIDKEQQIIWQTCQNNIIKATIWRMAKSYCENLYFLGEGGWRLPTAKELKTSLDKGMLKKIPEGVYWTATLDATDPQDNAMVVFSKNGFVSLQDRCENARIICVQ